MEKKTVAVITGTRAEYGLLRGVIFALQKSALLQPLVVVTGAHLSAEYGNTVAEIEADGVPIAAKINILKFGHGPLSTADTVACAITEFARWFEEAKPAAALVLGDRYEIFAAATAAALQGVPVAHISGGDVTLGAADDYYRHCITKMARLHFPSCETYAKRVIRMGEAPETVFNVGGLGDENIRKMPPLSREALSQSLGFDLSGPFALITFHPQTAGHETPEGQMTALLAAMDKTPGVKWLITKANADAGGEIINKMIDEWAAKHPGAAIAFTSLGVKRYLSAMRYAAFVAGNSSSGVVETPTFGVPTINIGSRQAGRIICENVLCCPAEKDSILKAFATAQSPEFVKKARAAKSPYNGGDTAARIVKILEQQVLAPDWNEPKTFYDGN